MSSKLTVVEISPQMSAGEAAATIQKHRVLVLVNLNGWTLNDRNDVFALQPSPVQVRRAPSSPLPSFLPRAALHPPPLACTSRALRSGGWAIPRQPAAAT
jgi:hypothetical protein